MSSPHATRNSRPKYGNENALGPGQEQRWQAVYNELSTLITLPLKPVMARYGSAERLLQLSIDLQSLGSMTLEFADQLFVAGRNALRRIASTLTEYFGQPTPTLEDFAKWTSPKAPRPQLDGDGENQIRSAFVCMNIDGLYNSGRQAHGRLESGMRALELASAAAATVRMDGKERRLGEVVDAGEEWKKEMFGYSVYALVGLAQCLSKRLMQRVVIWKQQVPGTT